ncbi:MAG: bifunctional phosphopantothenoylcysteine decarboxylase/phosphopantothenate synthase [Candidatus Limnocylindrales bacterium]|jgi:phosphopantothenoylcysteine decarboxylase/phosphopantothenate--cysteine ligase
MKKGSGRLAGRRIALGVTGSIAAYKSVELLRLLQAEGADVRVLMTPSATAFVGPLTLETLSHHPVDSDVLALQPDGRIGHISAANDVEAIVVAPATAHWLGAMANGLAGDAITAACLATSVPVVVAPAMDGGMYAHPATQGNLVRLRQFGYRIVEPERGPLASGMDGLGRLAALERIVEATVEALSGISPSPSVAIANVEPAAAEAAAQPEPAAAEPAAQPEPTAQPEASAEPAVAEPAAAPATPVRPPHIDFAGRHIVITAGGTAEPIDPVRFVGNRSTGKMGIAIAEDALDRGAAVTLILGHVNVDPPNGAHVARVETAAEMQAALRALTPPEGPVFDVLVMAAAVADFRPKTASDKKLGRAAGMNLELDATPDLLAEASERVRTGVRASGALRPILVGFAAETGATDRAADKVRAKGVDMLVANDVTEPGSGFGTDTNRVTIYYPEGAPEQLPMLTKREVAELLLDRILIRLDSRGAAREATENSTEPSPVAETEQGARPAAASRPEAAS